MSNVNVRFTSGKMNKDYDERLIPNGDYIDALNVRVNSTESSSIGALENAKGNSKLTTLKYNGVAISNAKCIGAYEDGSNETIYWFITSPTVDAIVSFNTNTSILRYHLLSETVLNFNENYPIDGVNLIDDILLWTDNLNPPRRINVNSTYPYPSGGSDQITEFDISVAVAPPKNSPTISLFNTPNDENYIKDKFISFAYRYKYKDGEYSAMSQFSEIAFDPANFKIDFATYSNVGMKNLYNSVNVTFNTGGRNVVGVDLCFKLHDSSVINVIERFSKKNEGWLDNVNESIVFTNKKVYTSLTESELLRVFDNVPRRAKAQTTMGNRLMYGNYVDGYNIEDANGNDINLEYHVDVISDTNIGYGDADSSLASGDSYTLDPLETKSVDESLFNIDLTGVNLVSGTAISIPISLVVDSHGGDSAFAVTPPDNDFSFELIFNLQRSFDSVYELATSQEFIDTISTHNAYTSCSTGTSLTDYFNCNISTISGWQDDTSGVYFADGQFEIVTSPSSSIIGIKVPAVRFYEIATPTNYAYQYFKFVNTNVTVGTLNSKRSLHSNRDYEVGVVYMDDYNRSSTALVCKTNTAFVPVEYSDSANSLRVTLMSPPPYWATKYKFVVKPSKSGYQTVYSNIFYSEEGYTWFKLDGDNRSKVTEDQTLIVKSDSNGVLDTVVETKVLALEAKSKDFIDGNVNDSGDEILEPSGLYMKLRANNFSAEYDPDSFIDLPLKSKKGSYPLLVFDLSRQVTFDPDPVTWEPIPVNGGSLISLSITFYRGSRGASCGSRKYLLERDYVASQNYDSIYDWIIGDHIDLTSGVTSGNDDTENTNEFFDTLATGVNIDSEWSSYDVAYFESITDLDKEGGVNKIQFIEDTVANKHYLGLRSGTPKCTGINPKNAYVKFSFQMQQGGSMFVFETEALDANSEIYYEGSESYDIINGYHTGNVQNQTSSLDAVIDLPFFDCFTFGNGAESYKISDNLAGMPFKLGHRVTAVSQEEYKEAHRYASITYSGIYNAETNINKLNEFNLALGNFKDCEKSFGPINLLFGRKTDILTLQEDKISYVLSGKNLLSDAAAGGAITSIPEVLGTQISRIEEYGISNGSSSFAVYGSDIYFTDSKRSSVINLKGGSGQSDQLIAISSAGMETWFRDRFKDNISTINIGGYDPYMKEYVLSIVDSEITEEIPTLTCGFTSTLQSGVNYQFYLDYDGYVGEASFDYDIDGYVQILVQCGTNSADSGITNTPGTISFTKSDINISKALVTVIPSTATEITVSGCNIGTEITVVKMLLNSPYNEGDSIHINYDWSLGGYTSPTSEDPVFFEADYVSGYSKSVGNQSFGVIPAGGSTITMRVDKFVTDSFDFDPALHKFKYLMSNTLYDQSNFNVMKPSLQTATPISNPSTGVYEASFTYSPSNTQYLYLVWDLTNYADVTGTLQYGDDYTNACCDVN